MRQNPSQSEEARSRAEILGTERILPLLAKMAIPATTAMAVTALYNVVDTIFIGRGVSSLAIGGLSIAYPIQMLVLAIALMVGIGGASIVSRSLGSKRPERAAKTVGTAFTTIVALSVVLVVAGLLAADELLILFGASEELLFFAKPYLVTVIPGAPFIAMAIASSHLVRSEGRANYSMFIVLTGSLLNIALDPIFIFGFNLGIRGAALATVISQFVSFLFVLLFYLKPYTSLALGAKHLIPDRQIFKEMMSLGVPAFVRQFGASFFIIFTNHALRRYGGDIHVAAFGVIMRVLTFSFMPLIGISHGFQPIVGFNFGAGNLDRVRETVRKTILVAFAVSLVFFCIVMLFPEGIFRVFTSDETLIEAGTRGIRIVLAAIPFIGLQMVGAVYFLAVGRALPAFLLSISRQIILLLPLVIILPLFFGLIGVWVAFPAADVCATVITVVWLAAAMKGLGKRDELSA